MKQTFHLGILIQEYLKKIHLVEDREKNLENFAEKFIKLLVIDKRLVTLRHVSKMNQNKWNSLLL